MAEKKNALKGLLKLFGGKASAEGEQASEKAVDGVIDLKVALGSPNEAEFSKAVTEISAKARNRDRSGLDVLEAVINARTGRPGECRFYSATGMSLIFDTNAADHIKTLVAYAKSDGLLAHAYEVQSCINPLIVVGQFDEALNQIRKAAGNEQARAFELLNAQMAVFGEYRAAKNLA
jgi:hypothetical protein